MVRQLASSTKLLAWFAIINGVLAITAPAWWPLLTPQAMPITGVWIYILTGLMSLMSGIFGLQAKRWAFLLLFLTFLIQCADYYSENFFVSFIGPLSLKVGLILKSPPGWFNVNVLAIVVCVLALRSAVQVSKSETSDA